MILGPDNRLGRRRFVQLAGATGYMLLRGDFSLSDPGNVVQAPRFVNKSQQDLEIRAQNQRRLEEVEDRFGIRLLSQAQLFEQQGLAVPPEIAAGSLEWDISRINLMGRILMEFPEHYYKETYVEERTQFVLGSTGLAPDGYFYDIPMRCCYQATGQKVYYDTVAIGPSWFDPNRKLSTYICLAHELGHQRTPHIGTGTTVYDDRKTDLSKIGDRQKEWTDKLLPILGADTIAQADQKLRRLLLPNATIVNDDLLRSSIAYGFQSIDEFTAVMAQHYVQGAGHFKNLYNVYFPSETNDLYNFVRDNMFLGLKEYDGIPML